MYWTSAYMLALRKLVIGNGLFILTTTIYFASYMALVSPLTNAQSSVFGIVATVLVSKILPIMLFAIVINRVYFVAKYQRPKSPIKAIVIEVWRVLSDRNRLMLGLPIIIIMLPFQYAFVSIKTNIPLIAPFSWDEVFYEIDKVVHLGVDPWLIVDPFFRLNDYFVLALSFNYSLWFVFMWATFLVYAFGRSMDEGRTRYLLAFFLTWPIGGSYLAIAFSSAGPAFFGDLGIGYDPYTPLISYLSDLNLTLPISAIDLQTALWNSYADGGHNYGISAMPSMHNATALLSAIGAWQLNRLAGIFLSIHAVLIYIGSFYLGWHYAIDAYLGWAVALAMWWLSGIVTRWWHGLALVRRVSDR